MHAIQCENIFSLNNNIRGKINAKLSMRYSDTVASRHEDVWTNGGKALLILKAGT
jgi:hypothetical protein